jgi:hypothetical protein
MQTSKVGKLTNIVKTSRSHKAELTYYKPQEAPAIDGASDERTAEQREFDIASWLANTPFVLHTLLLMMMLHDWQ